LPVYNNSLHKYFLFAYLFQAVSHESPGDSQFRTGAVNFHQYPALSHTNPTEKAVRHVERLIADALQLLLSRK
jgi:hypothetical protein